MKQDGMLPSPPPESNPLPPSLGPLQAIRLIVADYAESLPGEVLERLDIEGVQSAIFVAGGHKVMLIRGTNEKRDWLYNLDFMPTAYLPGDTWKWHRGFLKHAQIAYAFAKGKGIDLVIGHSLGAAAASIVAISLGVPAICFASPRPLFGHETPPGAAQIVNYCRVDDIITGLPFAGLGFNHCGQVRWLEPHGFHLGIDHFAVHYIPLLDLLEGNQ